jgi:hypothetical protein
MIILLYVQKGSFQTASEEPEVTKFRFIIATICRELAGFMDVNYVVGHERTRILLFECVVSIQ